LVFEIVWRRNLRVLYEFGYFILFFDKKLINSAKSGCEGQLSEIIFSGAKKSFSFSFSTSSKAIVKSGTDPLI
jgi:hypothetical protein